MKLNKTSHITGLLTLCPNATTRYIASKSKCTIQMVNYVRRNMERPKPKDSIVGFFTDIHEPGCHPRFFEFVRDTFRANNVTTVICGGDLVDHHFISRHVSEPDALNPVNELEVAIKHLEKWTKEFPEVLCCTGNHDSIPVRQAKELGIPTNFLKSLNAVYGLPKGWIWDNQYEVDGVLYEHGLAANGMYGVKNLALAYRQSVCVGHTHSYAGVYFVSSPKGIIFGLNGGCGIDTASYASRYSVPYKFKPSLGCSIIINGKEPRFIPMDMDKYRR